MSDDATKPPDATNGQEKDLSAPKVDPVWGVQSPLEPPVEAEVAAGESDAAVPVRSAEERALYEAAERAFPDFHIRWIKEFRVFGRRTGIRLLCMERRSPAVMRRGLLGVYQRLIILPVDRFLKSLDLRVGALPEPPLPKEPGPGEPPEAQWMLDSWRPMLWLACAVIGGIWGPVLLAGYGRRLAAQDRLAWEQRYGVPMPLVVPTAGEGSGASGEACNSADILHAEWGERSRWSRWSAEEEQLDDLATFRFVRKFDGHWYGVKQGDDGQWEKVASYSRSRRSEPMLQREFKDADRDALQGAYAFDSFLFPGRTASTYEPGSFYFETHRAQSIHEEELRRALACGNWPDFATYSDLWEWRDSVYDISFDRLLDFFGYRLHRAAFTQDWDGFDRDLDDLFTVQLGISARYGIDGTEILHEVLAQHGYAMPDATLAKLDRHLRSLPNDPPDEAEEIAVWERTVRRRLIAAVLREKGDGYFWSDFDTPYPVFVQTYAMRYPWTRGQVPEEVSGLATSLATVMSTPGRVTIGSNYGIWSSYDPEGLGAFGEWLQQSLHLSRLGRFARQRLMLAGVGALRARRANGTWPTRLGDCVEVAYHVDPGSPTAATLLLRVDSAGCLRLWSIGGDGVDDGGWYYEEIVQPKTGRNRQDGVLRLYVPPTVADDPADDTPTPEDQQ